MYVCILLCTCMCVSMCVYDVCMFVVRAVAYAVTREEGRDRGRRSTGGTELVQSDGLSIAGLRGVHSHMWLPHVGGIL